MGVYEENIVPVKISRLAEYVSSRRHITLDEALVYIYSNPLSEALYDEFERERKRVMFEVSKPAFEFFTYMLEKYAISKGISGLQAYAIFKEYNADEFLIDHYDLLHTQGTGYVLDELDRFMHRRKRK